MDIQECKKMLAIWVRDKEELYNKMLRKHKGIEFFAVMEYRDFLIDNRNLEKEVDCKTIERDFENGNVKKIKKDLELLDLIPKTTQETEHIIHIMELMKWEVKDLYKEYLNKCKQNMMAVVSILNPNYNK
ncbi:hypothetical protein G8V07_11420 [Clostridium botulinum D/C]|uniref:hypothetical protein n=1 Tax=Clostridium botulinum TaxID=1491 RepID=UPI001E617E74|nr:hypothetical protein [Clostridium botulinum]MCD3319494.1 hypothetical protein [Clostridium botulinum D/C]MCD3324359.1 hypothetical protein [Clostridium botulinum D/C]MCD3327360.1 hypothetical protein [Clostridium botulinum D/C]